MTLLLDSSSSSLQAAGEQKSEFVHLISASSCSSTAASSSKKSSSDMLATVQQQCVNPNNECVVAANEPAQTFKARPLSMYACKEGLSKLWKKEASSNTAAPTPATSDVSETSDNKKAKQNNRHSYSPASGSLRGKHPATRDVNTTQKNEDKTTQTKKKSFFEKRREKKMFKIEAKPVYKWNYKTLAKWLKYKGYDKKDINILKKDHLNGYVMLTIEVQDLISLGVGIETAFYSRQIYFSFFI
ncbi:hypothetical protein C9374_002801 [Naegleria lovaniensis]|uniref:SAM domain-containing protein n=1 Tax=Naegleria lovaniensis TaxID=51637 RepID=A0AA88GT20_NAELO|nr:uncharacterized protein C9374_002801 [Naegleria lovaniensis]KAG2386355.1 hypothetical protein C9374_002801 [Naegleria lovaniensis]